MTTSSLYTFGNAANVSANNFTTLYNTGAGIVNPQLAYGNANVQDFLAVGSDTGGNTVGNILSSGNITADYFIGNGSLLTGLAATYSNANVAAYLASGADTSNIITSGNISGGYILGNGSQLTGLPASYGNANVAAYLPTYTGNLAGSNLAITQNAVVSGNITSGQNMIAGGNIQSSGNIRTTGPSGNITGANYISASYFVGDGGLLSNITAGNASYATNAGHANVADSANSVSGANVVGTVANATYAVTAGSATTAVTVTGNAQPNITSVGTLTTVSTSGNISAVGNITGNYIIGNGSQLTGLPAGYSNVNAAAFLGNLGSNVISTTGNVTGGYFIGNGSQLTGLPASYGNANVVTFLANFGSNVISTTGNITGGYILGNGSLLTGITTNYSNANVAAYLPTYTGNLAGGNAIITSNVIAGNVVPPANDTGWIGDPAIRWGTVYASSGNLSAGLTVGAFASVTGNVTAGNLRTTGLVSATGNVTGNYFIGNGSQLTGITTNYSNANVAAYLPTYSGNLDNVTNYSANVVGNAVYIGNAATTANIPTGVYIHANGFAYSGTNNVSTKTIDAQHGYVQINGTGSANTALGVINGGTDLQALTVNANASILANLSVTGNVAGAYFIGNGSQLTGLPSGYSNADVANYLASGTDTLDIVTNGGNIQPATDTVGSLGQISKRWGYLFVDIANVGSLNMGGIINGYRINTSSWISAAGNITSAGNVTANLFIGNGSGLTNIPGANVTGTVANATYATTAGSANTATSATTAGTVTGNAQANITSLGTLTSLAVTGNTQSGNLLTGGLISATGNVTGAYFIGNGYALSSLNGANVVGDVPTATAAAAVQIPVKNTSGGSLAIGTPVYATGTVGATTTVEVSASRADTASTMGAIGLLTSTLGINATGYAISVGTLTGVDTSLYTVGQELYVGATGGVVGTRPTGTNIVQTVGTVGRVNATTGSIEVNIWDKNPLPNLGSGNIWIGNAAAYPTETTLATYTGNIGAGNISVTGNITGGNFLTGGLISATGNITGNYFIGNGSQLTGITATSTSNAFGNISVTGQTTVAAGNASSTLQLVAGTNITITTDAANGKVTITSTASGGGTSLADIFLLMGA